MRIFGWLYLLAYLADALINIAATLAPALHPFRSHFSLAVTFLTILVFILVCLDRFPPRRLFLLLSSFYLALIVFYEGVEVATEAWLKAFGTPVIVYLLQRYPWFGYVHWLLLLAWLGVALYGLYTYYKPAPVAETANSEPLAKGPEQALLVLASLILALIGIGVTFFCPTILGHQEHNVPFLFPLYAVGFYCLLKFLRRGGAAGGGAPATPATAPRFSLLPLLSLLLATLLAMPSMLLFPLRFTRYGGILFFLPLLSLAAIVTGHLALHLHKKGPALRGIGLAIVGLIIGYLQLLFFIYMSVYMALIGYRNS